MRADSASPQGVRVTSFGNIDNDGKFMSINKKDAKNKQNDVLCSKLLPMQFVWRGKGSDFDVRRYE